MKGSRKEILNNRLEEVLKTYKNKIRHKDIIDSFYELNLTNDEYNYVWEFFERRGILIQTDLEAKKEEFFERLNPSIIIEQGYVDYYYVLDVFSADNLSEDEFDLIWEALDEHNIALRIEDKELYSYDDVEKKLEEAGASRFIRKDSQTAKIWQFCKGGSSLNVATSRKKCFVLRATNQDFSNILNYYKNTDYAYVYIQNIESKSTIIDILSSAKEGDSFQKPVVFLKDGNNILHPSSAEKYLPHEIHIFTNLDLDLVIKVLLDNSDNRVK